MSDARDALAAFLQREVGYPKLIDLLAEVTFSDECTTCGGRGQMSYSGRGSDGPDRCPDCPEPRHALAAFAVESNPEAVIAELVRAGVLVTLPLEARSAWTDAPIGGVAFYCRALPDEVQTDG